VLRVDEHEECSTPRASLPLRLENRDSCIRMTLDRHETDKREMLDYRGVSRRECRGGAKQRPVYYAPRRERRRAAAKA